MSLTTLIGGVLLIGIVGIFIVSGKARTLGKGFINLFVEDLAATPEGAEALFRQKEEQVEESFRKADEVYKKIAGQLSRTEKELQSLKDSLPRIEKDCERLAQKGDREGLLIKAQERTDVMEDIGNHEEAAKELTLAKRSAEEARKACEDDLAEVKKQHKKTVSDLKRNAQMKEVYSDLEGIGANNHTSRMIDRVMEKSQELDDLVEGSRQAYESKTSTRTKKLNERLRHSETNDYADKLLQQYQTPLIEDKSRDGDRAINILHDPFMEELEKRRMHK